MASGSQKPEQRIVRAARALSVPWLSDWYSSPENRVFLLQELVLGEADLGPLEDVTGPAFLAVLLQLDQDFCWEVIGVLGEMYGGPVGG